MFTGMWDVDFKKCQTKGQYNKCFLLTMSMDIKLSKVQLSTAKGGTIAGKRRGRRILRAGKRITIVISNEYTNDIIRFI